MKKIRNHIREFFKGFASIFSIFEPTVWNYEDEFGTDGERLYLDWEKVGDDMHRAIAKEFSAMDGEEDLLKKKALIRNMLKGSRDKLKEVGRNVEELSKALQDLGGCGKDPMCEYEDGHNGSCSWRDNYPGS